MVTYLFKQLEFARGQTLMVLDGITENMAVQIPQKFRNHILWQAGHIYVAQERLTFSTQGLAAQLPKSYMAMFAPGTSPLTWTETPPTLSEVKDLLREQPQRIEQALRDRIGEIAPSPYTTSTGLTLETVDEFLSFSFYHEGMHFNSIKHYKMLLNS